MKRLILIVVLFAAGHCCGMENKKMEAALYKEYRDLPDRRLRVTIWAYARIHGRDDFEFNSVATIIDRLLRKKELSQRGRIACLVFLERDEKNKTSYWCCCRKRKEKKELDKV